MPTSNSHWICDVCGYPINELEHGMVQWIADQGPDGKPAGHSLVVVHKRSFSPRASQGGCQHDWLSCNVADIELYRLYSPDHEQHLISLVRDAGIPPADAIALAKRLHSHQPAQMPHGEVPTYLSATALTRLTQAQGMRLPDGK